MLKRHAGLFCLELRIELYSELRIEVYLELRIEVCLELRIEVWSVVSAGDRTKPKSAISTTRGLLRVLT